MAVVYSTPQDRINARVERIPESGCWIFMGCLNNKGYGQLNISKNNKKHVVLAHRYSYEAFKGEIPDGMFVMHSCDIPTCCNPEHLSVGTHAENMADCVLKGRSKVFRPRPKVIGSYKAKGTYVTRPPKVSADVMLKAKSLLSNGMTQKDVAKIIGISPQGLSKALQGRVTDRIASLKTTSN